MTNNCLVLSLCWTVGQEIRDRFSGAVEAFARRNGGTSNNNHHGEHSRCKALEEPLVAVSVLSFSFSFQCTAVPVSTKSYPIALCLMQDLCFFILDRHPQNDHDSEIIEKKSALISQTLNLSFRSLKFVKSPFSPLNALFALL